MTPADPGTAGDLRVLVVAKAPVPGLVKTRLGADVGMAAAAELAAAGLLDTMTAAVAAVGVERCHLSLAGDLAEAVDGQELLAAAAGWTVTPQVGSDFAARLVHAHREVPGPVVQVGMDTPQLTADLLLAVGAGLAEDDAVLAPAADGGWWALALRDPSRAGPLAGVPMSTPTTCDATRTALEAAGLSVGSAEVLSDVDTMADADLVAASAPRTRFARAWGRVSDARLDQVLVGGREPGVVELCEHDPGWAERYAEVEATVRDALGPAVRELHHIGSTAVPGLAAKPVVDILLVVDDVTDEAAWLPALERTGLRLRVREPGHSMLRTADRGVHLHVRGPADPETAAHLALRDRLRGSAADRRAYEEVKRELAEREWPDLNHYAAAKTAVIREILAHARR